VTQRKPEAITAIKPPPRMASPSSEYTSVTLRPIS